jgi:hypothetical protein
MLITTIAQVIASLAVVGSLLVALTDYRAAKTLK